MGLRTAKKPLPLPSSTTFEVKGNVVNVKGPKGALELSLHPLVDIKMEDNIVELFPKSDSQESEALAGTMRALLGNMVKGVTEGFVKKLTLIGVGYRASVQGNKLNLSLGFSHPVAFDIPEGIKINCPSQTEIVIEGSDKQLVGQVAAEIRAIRPPEPYKGKGVRYSDEQVILKETKK